jgi:ubiquinone/menaquinone biosynthesis C-methylase UbiE
VVAPPANSFDEQALDYDARAGLPATVGAAVAQGIVDRAGVLADDLVLELGAGTGEIGAHLARLPIRYVGLDASAAMLQVFRAKAAGSQPALIVANGDDPWPLPAQDARDVGPRGRVHALDPHALGPIALRRPSLETKRRQG